MKNHWKNQTKSGNDWWIKCWANCWIILNYHGWSTVYIYDKLFLKSMQDHIFLISSQTSAQELMKSNPTEISVELFQSHWHVRNIHNRSLSLAYKTINLNMWLKCQSFSNGISFYSQLYLYMEIFRWDSSRKTNKQKVAFWN